MSTQKQPLPYANKGNLTEGSIPAHLMRLTLPMVWGIMAVISVQLVDTYFIGLLGAKELAAISFTFPVTLSITHLLFGLNIAMSSVIARLLGSGDDGDAKRVVLHGIFLALCVSSVMAALCYMFLEPLFMMLGADADIFSYIKHYMPLWLIGTILVSVPMNGNSAIRAGGDAFKPAMVMTATALTNALLDPILIFGAFGIPAMGIKGAALASLIGYGVGMAAGLYLLIVDKKMMALDGLHLDQLKDSLKRLGFIALPAGLTNVIMPATGGFVVAILASYGHEAVAAFGVASRIEAFSMLVIIALSTGMAPIVGQNWGAENIGRVRDTIFLAIRFNLIWSLGIALLLAVFGRLVGGWFSDDPAVVDIIALYFLMVPFTYGVGNLVFGWASAFNAMGKPVKALVMIVVRSFVLTVPLVWLGHHFGGLRGIFAAIAMVGILSGGLFHWLSVKACRFHEH